MIFNSIFDRFLAKLSPSVINAVINELQCRKENLEAESIALQQKVTALQQKITALQIPDENSIVLKVGEDKVEFVR